LTVAASLTTSISGWAESRPHKKIPRHAVVVDDEGSDHASDCRIFSVILVGADSERIT